MTEKTKYEPGTFCWTDLGTTDAAAAKKFYAELFGWKAVDMPAGPDMTYTMLMKGDKDVCALYKGNQAGTPPAWLAYIAVASADEAAKKAESLGAKVIKPAFDVMDVGRQALIQDPTGAIVSLWQGKKHAGARLIGEAGAVCWDELMTNDVDRAGGFYAKLLGWAPKTVEMGGGMKYTLFSQAGADVAGMMQIAKEWGKVPPHWLVYFGVDDCDKSAAKVKALGGQVRVPPTDIPNVGRFAIVADAQGAAFGIIKGEPRK
jgi:predicted enzyme related to lactoylglutathione lyase